MAEIIVHDWNGICEAHYREVRRPDEYEYTVPSGISKIRVKSAFTLDSTAVFEESPVVIINGYYSLGDWIGKKEYHLGLSSPATMDVQVSAGDRVSIAMPTHNKGPFSGSDNEMTSYSFSIAQYDPDYTWVSLNGVKHKIINVYSANNGVLQRISEGWSTVDGIKKIVYSEITKWEVWDTKQIAKSYKESYDGFITRSNRPSVTLGDQKIFDPSTGKYSGAKIGTNGISGLKNYVSKGYIYYFYNDESSIIIIQNVSGENSNLTISGDGYSAVPSTFTTGKGDNFIEYVYNKDPFAYPENGEKNGFWYIKV